MDKIRKRFKYKYCCPLCSVKCSSVCQLWDHVLGFKHKRRMEINYPGREGRLISLQYFVDTYLKDYPLLGLEYIVEIRENFCTYECQLCAVTCSSNSAVGHVTGITHLGNYVKKHHPKEIEGKDLMADTGINLMTWHETAVKIHSAYGRKKIQVIKKEDEGPTPAKVPKSSPKRTEPPCKTTDALPDTSRKERSPLKSCSKISKKPLSRRQRIEKVQMDMMESLEFLQINCNADFLEFLRNFEIQNDEDAVILKELTQNCTMALIRFREEQLNAELTQGSPASSGPASTDTDRACRESTSCDPQSLHNNDWSLSQGSVRKDNDASKPDESSDATETFFSNIKDMEGSEVIAVFEKIAAENPAFHAINIPDVIRYLQDTGRLKKT